MHATAIVTDALHIRDEHPSDMVDPRIEYADSPVPCAFGICRQTFADRNVDRRVESAGIDISARHPRDANVDPAAICLPDAYVDGERAPPSPASRPIDRRRTPDYVFDIPAAVLDAVSRPVERRPATGGIQT